jgi:UDP-N-acetyl-D-mannosaminuronic acid transferase (WecB/TagA/CpsF family)
MDKLTLYGTPIALPELTPGESFFSKSLGKEVGIYQEAGYWDLFWKKRQAKKPGFPNRLYPSTFFLKGVLRSLTFRKIERVLPTEVFYDLMAHASGEKCDVLFITDDPASHREFKRQMFRLIPELPALSYLESYLTNRRPDDMLSLIKKLVPRYIYLGDDIENRQAWTARLIDQVPGIKAIVWGSGEFRYFTGHRPEHNAGTSWLSEALIHLQRSPSRIFIFPVYLFFLLDFFRLKWFHRLKLENLS